MRSHGSRNCGGNSPSAHVPCGRSGTCRPSVRGQLAAAKGSRSCKKCHPKKAANLYGFTSKRRKRNRKLRSYAPKRRKKGEKLRKKREERRGFLAKRRKKADKRRKRKPISYRKRVLLMPPARRSANAESRLIREKRTTAQTGVAGRPRSAAIGQKKLDFPA